MWIRARIVLSLQNDNIKDQKCAKDSIRLLIQLAPGVASNESDIGKYSAVFQEH